MAYSTDNQLVKNLIQTEEKLQEINPHCSIKITVYAESVGELYDAHRVSQLDRRIDVDDLCQYKKQFYFEYLHPKRPNILVRVSTK